MTDNTRLAAMEAVAEAARVWCRAKARTDEMHYAMVGALAALDAFPAQPPGETVEVYGVIKDDDGVIYMIDHSLQDGYAGHVIANVTARVLLPAVPTITADVEVTP